METIEEAIKKCERTPGSYKSFFAKRLEQHLSEKGVSIPDRVFALLDTPFKDFTPEYVMMYEQKIKGQALFFLFSDMLVEIYEHLDADKTGWEAAAGAISGSGAGPGFSSSGSGASGGVIRASSPMAMAGLGSGAEAGAGLGSGTGAFFSSSPDPSISLGAASASNSWRGLTVSSCTWRRSS